MAHDLTLEEVPMIGMRRFGVVPGIVLVVFIVLGAAGIGWLAYNAGVENGLAQSAAGEPPIGHPGYWYGLRPFGPGFGLLGCLVPLFLFFLFFGAWRMVFWPRRMGRWGGPRGKFGHGSWSQHFDEEIEEWHRKAHGTGEDPEREAKA
jgi:hypothetical protein